MQQYAERKLTETMSFIAEKRRDRLFCRESNVEQVGKR